MYNERENITDELMQRKIKPSFNRIKVLEYLVNNRNHPTVDQIYTSLKKELPTLSKATIYNTLGIFADAHLVKVLTIDDNETRYDITVANHGHFKCESCGNITDFKVDIDNIPVEDLANYIIKDKNVYFKGICPRCVGIKEI